MESEKLQNLQIQNDSSDFSEEQQQFDEVEEIEQGAAVRRM